MLPVIMSSLAHNTKTLSLPRWLSATGACFVLLVLQHVLIFWQHYTGAATFINDFARIYYPITAFWISLVQNGIFPEWTPFQNMGLPFVLSMQSGIFYPPLWLFTIFKTPFTLHMAAIVQVLHVLWGAIGCWMYLRLLQRSHGAALFAAVAFQFFGGFYSNSEHNDIIRAFSFIPWLFWVIQITPSQHKLSWRNWLAPLMVMLFVTGAYQGNLVSHLFIVGIFWCLSLVSTCFGNRQQWKLPAVLHVQIAALGLLGLLLCSVYLLPTFALKSSLARDGVWVGQTMNWPISYWNALIMPSNADGLFILPSMLSAFVTVPVFCLLFLASRDVIQRNGLWMCITVLALMMASGNKLFVYSWLVKILPPLGSSRFPSSDYRGIFCFGLILLSSGLLDDYLKGTIKAKLKVRAAWCLGLLLFFYLGIVAVRFLSSQPAVEVVDFLAHIKTLSAPVLGVLLFVAGNTLSAVIVEWPVAIVLSGLVFLSLYFYKQRPAHLLLTLLLLEMISGLYFVNRFSLYWRSDVTTDSFYQEVNRESPYSVMEPIRHPVGSRPACHDMNAFVSSWRGYLLGDFMCQTQDSKTKPRAVVNANAAINFYMRQGWQPRLITAEQLAGCKTESLALNPLATGIYSLAYGLQRIDYQVNASSDFCFVENELLFPGWTGSIPGVQQQIQPQAYCAALRSWCLPKGEYTFVASYRTPWLREGAMLSLLFFVFYMALCAYNWRRTGQK
jgi:hypothetical protein